MPFQKGQQYFYDPIRLARIGEQRWWAKNAAETIHNPIRLVRMVKSSKAWCEGCSIEEARILFGRNSDLIHHPCKTDGVLCSIKNEECLAIHLIHHPHQADGVSKLWVTARYGPGLPSTAAPQPIASSLLFQNATNERMYLF